MKHVVRLMAVLGVVALAFVPGMASGEVTLEGGFVWERDDEDIDGPLKAVLTPTGDGTWDVAFHFDWEDGPHTYKGTCEGSMDGKFSGNVTGDGERESKFRFSGAFEDGTFKGEHGWINDDGEFQRAGTLHLEKPASKKG